MQKMIFNASSDKYLSLSVSEVQHGTPFQNPRNLSEECISEVKYQVAQCRAGQL